MWFGVPPLVLYVCMYVYPHCCGNVRVVALTVRGTDVEYIYYSLVVCLVMYVCTYVRMYLCTYVCMYVRMYLCTYVRMYVCMCDSILPLYGSVNAMNMSVCMYCIIMANQPFYSNMHSMVTVQQYT